MSDDWDFYAAKVDHQPASIMVNLGIRQEVPKASHPYVSYLSLFMLRPREDGLSSNDEFDDLCSIGDAIQEKIESADHLYVGRNTSSGTRDFYFYTPNPEKLDSDLQAMMTAFPSYEYETGLRKDPQWDVYLSFLYPDKNAMQQISNRRVCEALSKAGDDLHAARVIDHRAYFKDKKLLRMFASFLVENGFALKEQGRVRPLFGDYFVDFERTDIPTLLDDVVFEITNKVTELEGVYDGWGCSITNALQK